MLLAAKKLKQAKRAHLFCFLMSGRFACTIFTTFNEESEGEKHDNPEARLSGM